MPFLACFFIAELSKKVHKPWLDCKNKQTRNCLFGRGHSIWVSVYTLPNGQCLFERTNFKKRLPQRENWDHFLLFWNIFVVTKGGESRSFISEKILWGEREAGARGSNRFAKSVCEAAFAATWFSSFCWCITNFPDFKLVLTGRKLTQNCVFPICVDLFPMFAPFPPFQPSSWLSVDQSCSTGPNNVATILSPQQRNEPKDFFTEKTKLDLNQI